MSDDKVIDLLWNVSNKFKKIKILTVKINVFLEIVKPSHLAKDYYQHLS